ncbi:MAG TPA: sensor histidine kinase [Anaerolineae bacterium]|nr:sensor histidine kinase [Anaerolineae bacterium]HID83510.1 hypothetical protein [Anaerolineales bacterium]HIQ09268.1 hypothetical protein [Anaerolineaceae bacterium]
MSFTNDWYTMALWVGGGLLLFLLGLFVGLAIRRCRGWQRRAPKTISAARSRSRSEMGRLKALYELLNLMMSTLNYQRVLDLSQDIALKAVSASERKLEPLVTAALLFEDDGLLHVRSGRRLPPRDMRVTFPAREGALARAVEQRAPLEGKRPYQDPELRRMVALHACESFFLYPLVQGHEAFGLLLYAHPNPQFFASERREILSLIGGEVMIALENARLYHELEQEKQRLAHIEEDTRKKLARDLHDGPTQTVAAIAMRLNIVRRLMEKDPQAALEELSRIEDMARRTNQEIRHMLFTLRPLVLETEGLEAALQALADKMRETYGQNVIVQVASDVVWELDADEQMVIFHIAEEAVNNARKHAEAEHIWVRLRRVQDNFALLEVIDDGKGFNVEEVLGNYETRGSLGMVNMQERAEMVRGVVELDSKPGAGTRVHLWIPLNDEAANLLRRGKRPA